MNHMRSRVRVGIMIITHIFWKMCRSVDAVLAVPQNVEAQGESTLPYRRKDMNTMEKMNICATEELSAQQTAYSPSKVAELTRRIIGGQTIAQFAEKAGVSSSWLTKMANGKLPGAPTRRMLTKLFENSEDPTVQLSELLMAAGLEPDKSETQFIDPNSLVSTYLGEGTLVPLSIFMNAVELSNHTSFSLQYDRHKFVVDINGGEKRYVCFPAMCYGLEGAEKVVIAETMLNMVENKAEDANSADSTTTYVLTDKEKLADYFKRLSEGLMRPIKVLLTTDNITAYAQ